MELLDEPGAGWELRLEYGDGGEEVREEEEEVGVLESGGRLDDGQRKNDWGLRKNGWWRWY